MAALDLRSCTYLRAQVWSTLGDRGSSLFRRSQPFKCVLFVKTKHQCVELCGDCDTVLSIGRRVIVASP